MLRIVCVCRGVYHFPGGCRGSRTHAHQHDKHTRTDTNQTYREHRPISVHMFSHLYTSFARCGADTHTHTHESTGRRQRISHTHIH